MDGTGNAGHLNMGRVPNWAQAISYYRWRARKPERYFRSTMPAGARLERDQFTAWMKMLGKRPMKTVAAAVTNSAKLMAGVDGTGSSLTDVPMNMALAIFR